MWTWSTALRLLSLPRALGSHPDTGKEVRAGVGRFGPYVSTPTERSNPSR